MSLETPQPDWFRNFGNPPNSTDTTALAMYLCAMDLYTAPKTCRFCKAGERFCTEIKACHSITHPIDAFETVLHESICRGYCTKRLAHNLTDYKYLNGANLKLPTKRDRNLYLDLFTRGYSFDDLLKRNPKANLKNSIIIPICNVLAWGSKLDLEKCGIPISNQEETTCMEAIYKEVFDLQTIPSRFSKATFSKEPSWPYSIFIYAKMRGRYTRHFHPEVLCDYSGLFFINDVPEPMPNFCDCNMCCDDHPFPQQCNVITPEQRQRMETNRRIALTKLAHKKSTVVTISPQQRQRMETNRQAALAKLARKRQRIV